MQPLSEKEKSWLWNLTWPIAHNNFTIIFDTVYKPKGSTIPLDVWKHEFVHAMQAERVGGWFIFYFLYLFCFPILWNPFRKKWELEAYIEGSGISEDDAKRKIRSVKYGFIL